MGMENSRKHFKVLNLPLGAFNTRRYKIASLFGGFESALI
jgi:hypothetical protein